MLTIPAWAQVLPIHAGEGGHDPVSAAGAAVAMMVGTLGFLLVCLGIWAWRMRRRTGRGQVFTPRAKRSPEGREPWEKPEDWWKRD